MINKKINQKTNILNKKKSTHKRQRKSKYIFKYKIYIFKFQKFNNLFKI